MSTLAELKGIGESLGLVDRELADFICKQQAMQREDREKERVQERLRIEERMEEARVQAELEQGKLRIEEARVQADQEYRMAQLQQEAAPASETPTSEYKAPKVQLPLFGDDDDLTAYLSRFELLAKQFQWPEVSMCLHLGSLLKNKKALDIYSTLPEETSTNYAALKEALMSGFKCSADFYRKQFRSHRVSVDDTYNMFVERLKRLLSFWLNAAGTGKTYDDLFNFIVMDQVMASSSPELRVFFKEQQARTLSEMITLADAYLSAHSLPTQRSTRKTGFRSPEKSSVPRSSRTSVKPPLNRSWNSGPQTSTSNTSCSRPITQPTWSQRRPLKCFACGDTSHLQRDCPRNPASLPGVKRETVQNVLSADSPAFTTRADPQSQKAEATDPVTGVVNLARSAEDLKTSSERLAFGFVNGTPVPSIFRDTGATCILISDKLLPDAEPLPARFIKVSCYLGRVNLWPVIRCYIDCPFFKGWAEAGRAPLAHCAVLIGDVPGACSLSMTGGDGTCETTAVDGPPEVTNQVVTRSQAQQPSSAAAPAPLPVSPCPPTHITPSEFQALQNTCPTLDPIRACIAGKSTKRTRDGLEFEYLTHHGLLYRECVNSPRPYEIGRRVLVVPSKCRQKVMEMAHDSPMAGHYSHKKTLEKVLSQFCWPGAAAEIKRFCKSCAICQRCSQGGRTKKAPLILPTISTEPFSKVAMDIVGPITPPSSAGHRFILTIVDCATRFPEAVPLRSIDSTTVAESLVTIFSRVGIPKEVISDQGRQFVSDLMGEVHRLLTTRPVFTAPYHPQANGICERFNGVLKNILRKVCLSHPRRWHLYIAPALFAVREMPHSSLKFSPFELLYGRRVRGPLTILRELWSNQQINTDIRTIYQYVFELRNRLEDAARIAAQNAEISGKVYKQYFDRTARTRSLKIGEEVLLLLPTSHNKLLMQWRGPFTIVDKRNDVDYVINVRGKLRLYHINMLKKFERRHPVQLLGPSYFTNIGENEDRIFFPTVRAQVCVVEGDDIDEETPPFPPADSDEPAEPYYGPDLTPQQTEEARQLVRAYSDVVTHIPGLTSTLEHTIRLTCTEPIRKKSYPVPLHLRSEFDRQVDELLEMGFISPSHSPYCSPTVMVRKANGKWRLCLDSRPLNNITEFDAEPMPLIFEELYRFKGSKFITELDLCKAYFQLPLSLESRKFTAFATSRGLMEFNRMPFGLSTACASYVRLMRIVLHGLNGVCCYFDNIYVFSPTWTEHLEHLALVLDRLRLHHLTVGPEKCFIGFSSLPYLGFQVGLDAVGLPKDRIQAIGDLPYPKTKKLMRSFIGMVSYYRRFIPHFADHSAHLTNQLKKETKEPLERSTQRDHHFNALKEALLRYPVLTVPDISREFIVRCDASTVGLGAVLLQEDQSGTSKPIAYASRKLLPRETHYSTIEKECLALVWAIKKFNFYLYGRKFCLETDHKALQYLKDFSDKNARVLRWALTLQPYHFQIKYIKGSENHGPDLLSRSTI